MIHSLIIDDETDGGEALKIAKVSSYFSTETVLFQEGLTVKINDRFLKYYTVKNIKDGVLPTFYILILEYSLLLNN